MLFLLNSNSPQQVHFALMRLSVISNMELKEELKKIPCFSKLSCQTDYRSFLNTSQRKRSKIRHSKVLQCNCYNFSES